MFVVWGIVKMPFCNPTCIQAYRPVHLDFIDKAFDAPWFAKSLTMCVCSFTLNWQDDDWPYRLWESKRAAYSYGWLRLTLDDFQRADMVPIMLLGTISWIYLIKYEKQEHFISLIFYIFWLWLPPWSNSISKITGNPKCRLQLPEDTQTEVGYMPWHALMVRKPPTPIVIGPAQCQLGRWSTGFMDRSDQYLQKKSRDYRPTGTSPAHPAARVWALAFHALPQAREQGV